MSVVRASRCPIHSCRVRSDTSPDAAIRMPNVCRRSWNRTTRTPARRQALEALADLGTVERVPRRGVPKDEIVELGVLGEDLEGVDEEVGEGHAGAPRDAT